ncbi:acyl-CoA dehydrogenase family protein [Alloalcanivorax xenomutans]|jgi:acyl-CoA dehydrogenase|uniref:Acyl-CoA dehydrogenase family protein n=1 Tax=Alloalcanivorax xenomutans TaxID=1094342 RepID=A0A9Q3W835_9GAMM|nr:acyl-CoA dehydrogenase family protein [Alloalcanivorax xenomutans]MBA4719590.1 acyl-CoA dehydrogenase family protein [Alcanivorax sp.]MCE7510759.1 acyl-CoA dehydrogenase family protein [Alloalcanivorax xenomutans]MCE7522935.1 acyl-CoA dehydrogenase family protein [Alloalcanivorax xenomutans]PHS69635.1 MAG: acyl-CoA dehydrogenase [Alcanivorax sp.]WOA31559.1 acyl-CoA dehydrogenase family protein [Alloalcanivorax xenomutans]|tara:strand:+ start:2656 stop:3795 length:1140 start_codon:yes stop_codon:yes gene_type:complete
MLDQNEIELFRDNVRKFLEKEVAPHYDQWEKEEKFPRELWNQLGENGFLCVDVPEAYGGFGADFRLSAVIVEEASRLGFGALASNLSVHSDIVAPYILHLGTEEQKQAWLPKMVTGEAVGSIGMTEPGAGSDLQGMKTRAEKDGDHYVINGQKTFITNGQHSDVIVLATKTDPNAGAKGVTLFTVDATTAGFSRGRNLEKMGHHAADTSELFFQDVRVGADQILGGEGKGFFNLMNELPRERLILALSAVAACEGMLERTIEYVQERQAFGQSVAKFQNTRFVLANLHAMVEVNKAFTSQCIDQYGRGELSTTNASIAKLMTTELQGKVADQCLQLFGGYGYMKEYPISRDYVDARIQRIYGGTSEIMKEIIARDILGR